jgi:pimeloyl-ACP methyl ester carboxylesterase
VSLLEGPWKHDCVGTNGIKLHYVTQGEGPLMLMLHGFPEFWYSWRHQIPEFAKDYKVVAVDLRGYNDSDRPKAKSAYVMDEFVKDVKGVIEGLGYESCVLVAHDWGGAIAWAFAYEHLEMVDRLIVMNLPHPAIFAERIRKPGRQMLRSWYVFFFQIPRLPEWWLRRSDYKAIGQAFEGMAVNKRAFSKADIEAFKDSAARPGALTAMVNYYRNVFSGGLRQRNREWPVLEIPTLMIWGENDSALGKELTYGTERFVKDFRIKYIPNCSHWVQQEQPDLVNRYMREFLDQYPPTASPTGGLASGAAEASQA